MNEAQMNEPMMQLVQATPEQLRWGLSLETPQVATTNTILILGMGGSAMAGRVAALCASSGDTLVHVHQGYELPRWAVAKRATVLAISYSGNTEETLSGMQEAVAAGLDIAVIASGGALGQMAADAGAPSITIPGGLQPRAALGYQASAAVVMLGAMGAIDDAQGLITEAADQVERLLGDGTGAAFSLGADLAAGMDHALPVVIGAQGVGYVAATRWVAQINENSKRAAFSSEAPELNHNALEAWMAKTGEPGKSAVIVLHDPHGHPRNQRRMALTVARLGGDIPLLGEVIAQGEGLLARFFSLIIVGDVASVVLADAAGVDAMPVENLEDFKNALREETS